MTKSFTATIGKILLLTKSEGHQHHCKGELSTRAVSRSHRQVIRKFMDFTEYTRFEKEA